VLLCVILKINIPLNRYLLVRIKVEIPSTSINLSIGETTSSELNSIYEKIFKTRSFVIRATNVL
jgi:hypothetical protein